MELKISVAHSNKKIKFCGFAHFSGKFPRGLVKMLVYKNMYFFKTTGLVIITWIALGIAAAYGPISQLPTAVVINENYFSVVRNHELLLGFVGFMIALLTNLFVKTKIWLACLAAFIAGTLFYTATQVGDPDFMSYLIGNVVEFHSHYLISGAAAAIIFVAITKLLKGTKSE